MELILGKEVYQIAGAAIEVHKVLGSGFLEAVYQEALSIEFQLRGIPFVSQPQLQICYKDNILNKLYYPDFLCFDTIIVELKAITKLGGSEESQLINYLKATGKHVGLLLNFGSVGKLEWKKIVF
ncbi:MAG: GxxExxY protein [Geobacteraceae bacterium]|nr:GxxExxY protein [Geobacteraceae bacterium]